MAQQRHVSQNQPRCASSQDVGSPCGNRMPSRQRAGLLHQVASRHAPLYLPSTGGQPLVASGWALRATLTADGCRTNPPPARAESRAAGGRARRELWRMKHRILIILGSLMILPMVALPGSPAISSHRDLHRLPIPEKLHPTHVSSAPPSIWSDPSGCSGWRSYTRATIQRITSEAEAALAWPLPEGSHPRRFRAAAILGQATRLRRMKRSGASAARCCLPSRRSAPR